MPILSLPTELLLSIAEQECLTRVDHWALVLVNKQFSIIFLQLLYRSIRIIFPLPAIIPKSYSPSSKFAVGDPTLQSILERLDKYPHLRACVRKCRIENLTCRNRYYAPALEKLHPEWVLDPVFTLIGQFINLNSISFFNTYIPTECLLYFARHPVLRLSFELRNAWSYNAAWPEGAFGATVLENDRDILDSFTSALTFGGSLTHLSLPKLSLGTLTAAHAFCKRPVLESLVSLVLSSHGEDGPSFLACTPNLIRLEFLDDEPRSRDSEEWDSVLPKLETIRCSFENLLRFTKGRSITSIAFIEGIRYGLEHGMPIETGVAKHFGSDVPVRRLYVGFCTFLREFFFYVVNNSAGIEELEVVCTWMNHKDCESCSLISFLPSIN